MPWYYCYPTNPKYSYSTRIQVRYCRITVRVHNYVWSAMIRAPASGHVFWMNGQSVTEPRSDTHLSWRYVRVYVSLWHRISDTFRFFQTAKIQVKSWCGLCILYFVLCNFVFTPPQRWAGFRIPYSVLRISWCRSALGELPYSVFSRCDLGELPYSVFCTAYAVTWRQINGPILPARTLQAVPERLYVHACGRGVCGRARGPRRAQRRSLMHMHCVRWSCTHGCTDLLWLGMSKLFLYARKNILPPCSWRLWFCLAGVGRMVSPYVSKLEWKLYGWAIHGWRPRVNPGCSARMAALWTLQFYIVIT